MEGNTKQQPCVTLVRSSAVAPELLPHHRQIFYLSSLDLFWRVIPYIRRILFFSTDLPFSSVLRTLKESLILALSHFFLYAGRLARDEAGRFCVDCSSEVGVEFVEAIIDLPFSALGENFEMQPFFEQLAGLGAMTESCDRCNTPLLVVQVTQFLGGGIALGLASNHVIADGYSLWHFMMSWAEISRGTPLTNPPQNNRDILRIDYPSLEIGRPPFEFVDGDQGSTVEQQLVQRAFHITGEQIQKLKEKASEAGGSFSSYEVTLSHLWKCFAKAQGLSAEERLDIVVLIDCRRRLFPPLGHDYFGNAVFLVKAMATTGELLNESLAATADRIHRQIVTCDDESVKAFMHWLELRDTMYGNFKLDTASAMAVSSPRFPVYEVDFGWGKARCVRPGKLGDGMIAFFPGREGRGSIEVCICLKCSAMEALQSDPLFIF